MTDPQEQERLSQEKAIVINNRIGGSLAISRAFGDFDLKKYGVSVIPYVSSTQVPSVKVAENLSKSSSYGGAGNFLIVACDGVWDVMSDQEAVDLLVNIEDAQKAAEKLVQSAIDLGSRDNVSVVVLKL